MQKHSAWWWISKYIQVLVDSWFGILFQREYDAEWDKELLSLMENYFPEQGYHTAEFHTNDGVVEAWTANKWYAYGIRFGKGFESGRPSIKTMILLEQHIKENINA